MMWERDEDKLALLELLEAGRIRRRAAQSEAHAILAELPWTRRTGRRDELELIPERRDDLVELLDRVWPSWKPDSQALAALKFRPTPADWRRLQDVLRAQEVAKLPSRLNRRTAASMVAPHSKAGLSSIRRAALGETTTTRDGIVRLRPPPGLAFARGKALLDAAALADVLGEIAITERALLDGTSLIGTVPAVLLVENLGPFQDLNPPEGWLLAHVPGWNTATVQPCTCFSSCCPECRLFISGTSMLRVYGLSGTCKTFIPTCGGRCQSSGVSTSWDAPCEESGQAIWT
jgi:hypothetical protein